MPRDVSLFKKNVCMFYSKTTSHILEADEQHKGKIKVDSQITIAQNSELSSVKRQNINAQTLSISNLYCSVLLSKSLLLSFR